VSVSTVDLARQAAYTTLWSEGQWLEALAWIPAEHELDDFSWISAVAAYAASLGVTPRAAVAALFPEVVVKS
jgi:hypothetical protein